MSAQNAETIFASTQFMRGMTYAGYHREVFLSPESDLSVDHMIKAGVQWVAIAIGWWQKDASAVEIAPHPSKTPSDESLIHLIQYLQARGIQILLKPFVDSYDHTWRAQFTPSSERKWFKSYLRFILHYAEIAESFQLPLFSVGCENILGTKWNRRFWKKIIRKVRKCYTGALTYAANFNAPGAYQDFVFWELLDYIGIDAYFPLETTEERNAKSLAQAWQTHIADIARWRSQRGLEQPVLFTELGLCSYHGASAKPWEYTLEPPQNWEEQAHYYQAFFEAFSAVPWMQGVFWWWWDNPSTSDFKEGGKDYALFYTPRGKHAEQVLKAWYS